MEKEGAEKATTEFDNSVTGKEDNSLAEKNENNNGAKAEITDISADVELQSATIEAKAEDFPPAAESEKGINPSEESVESDSEAAAVVGKKEKPEDSEEEEKTQAIEENLEIGRETTLVENNPKAEEVSSDDSGTDAIEQAAEAESKDAAAIEEEPSVELDNKVEELPQEAASEDKSKNAAEESIEIKSDPETDEGKKNDAPGPQTEDETPASKKKPEEEPIKIETVVDNVADTVKETAKPEVPHPSIAKEKSSDEKETASDDKEIGRETTLVENKPKTEEVSSDDSGTDAIEQAAEAESKDAAAIEQEPSVELDNKVEDLPQEAASEDKSKNAAEESIEIKSDPETDEGKKNDAPGPQTEDETPASKKKPEEEPIKIETVVDNVADTVKETAKPEVQHLSKAKEKSSDEKEPASDDKVIAEHHEGDEHHEEYQNVDFTAYSKEELVAVIKNLGKDDNPFLADRILKQIAPLFNQIRGQEREDALKKFVKEGGVEDDFQYKPDEFSLRFDANYKLIKDKKTKKFKEQDKERAKNLIIAEEVLGELRNFVDSEESSNSFNAFKAIQQKWKDIGDVPSQISRTLWANYNALVHRFYDQRSIYFELKELDRRKNYEYKLILCDKAEALVNVENLREAIKGLNDLHHEFKHMGPVPQDVQEALWQRFKAASDKIYERRKAFVHELKAELHENLVKKQELIDKIKLFIEFQSDRIKEWNEKTKELIALQKAWETIGGLPKDKAKQINKDFWSSFKKFFSNKHQFFKKLDADREEHLTKKQALLEQATALKDSEEWEKTANELKKLQSQWREIGPVPEKMRKKLYEEFKASCDHFFEQRRVGLKNSQDDYKANLQNKKKVIGEIINLKKDADKNLDRFNELRKEFLAMGYVPKKDIAPIKEEFQNAVEDYLNALTVLNIKQKTEISLEAEFASLAGSEHSETELYHKEQSVRRQINKLEDDIGLWQNNLEFFAHSKSTDKLREEVNKKIDDATVHVDSLKRQLKMLRTL